MAQERFFFFLLAKNGSYRLQTPKIKHADMYNLWEEVRSRQSFVSGVAIVTLHWYSAVCGRSHGAAAPPGGWKQPSQDEEVFGKWTRQARGGIEGKGRRKGNLWGDPENVKTIAIFISGITYPHYIYLASLRTVGGLFVLGWTAEGKWGSVGKQ